MSLLWHGSSGVVAPPDIPGPNRLLVGPLHHAWVGTTCRYYWRGGVAHAADYTGITFSHEGQGTSTSDLWSWTPGAEDVGDHTLVLKDSSGGRVTQTVRVHDGGGAATMRALTLGDSITAWDGNDTPWIRRLRDSLTAAGITCEFDGPRQQDTNPISGLYHNAKSGRTYGLAEELATPNPAAAVSAWVTTYGQPTHAVCALSTNDITNVWLGTYSLVQAMAYAREMVDALLTHTTAKVAITLAYAFNPTTGPLSYLAARRTYQEEMLIEFAPEIASGAVHILNGHACTSTGDYFDGLHPNGSSGHGKIHDQFYPWYRAVAAGLI